MVRRSHFWTFVQNKKCSLCGETLNSSHASNIRKHFLRKHRNEYDQILDEQQQIIMVQQLITRGTKRKRNGKEDNGETSGLEAFDGESSMYNGSSSLNFSDFNNHHQSEPNNNSFPLLLNGFHDNATNDENHLDDYDHSSSFHSGANENHMPNRQTSIEILDGEELDMSTIGQQRVRNQEMDTMADFARFLAESQLSNEAAAENGKREKEDDSSQLVADLMRQFYDLGWVFGSGGAMCIRNEGYTYVTPSAIQKDRLRAEDIGVYNPQNELIAAPKTTTVSSCINLFWTIFRTNDKQNPSRPLNAVIHTHSIEANLMASFPLGYHYDQIHLSNEEMLKGIVDRVTGKPFTNTQTVLIPVIENSPSEGCPEFNERIENAMLQYPSCSAILVRNHGAFYFGSSWEETKIISEIFEYLFKLTLEKMKYAPRICEQVFFSTATTSQ